MNREVKRLQIENGNLLEKLRIHSTASKDAAATSYIATAQLASLEKRYLKLKKRLVREQNPKTGLYNHQ